jgi:hypothetical protein
MNAVFTALLDNTLVIFFYKYADRSSNDSRALAQAWVFDVISQHFPTLLTAPCTDRRV